MKRHQQYYTGPRRKVGPTMGFKVLLKRLYKDTIWYFRVELGHWLLGEKEEHLLPRIGGIEYKGSDSLLNIIRAEREECRHYRYCTNEQAKAAEKREWPSVDVKNPKLRGWKKDAALFMFRNPDKPAKDKSFIGNPDPGPFEFMPD